MDTARRINKRILNPGFSSCTASYDVASIIRQSLGGGGGVRAVDFPEVCGRTRRPS